MGTIAVPRSGRGDDVGAMSNWFQSGIPEAKVTPIPMYRTLMYAKNKAANASKK
jgi:hypothetical protein